MSEANQQTIDTYNATVDKYIETSPQVVSGDLKEWIDAVLSKLDTKAKILEIGSGSGKDDDYFTSKGYTMELTDASQSFVDYLKSKGKMARVLNVLKDDLGTDYDLVFADAVLLHFTKDETELVLHKVYTALKQGGQFMFSLKAGEGEEITKRKLESDRYFCFWQKPAVEALLKATGFTQVHTKVIDDYRGKARPDWLLITAQKGIA